MSSWRELTYYGVGGPVGRFVAPHSLAAMQTTWRDLCLANEPVVVVGSGSNIVCSDEPFEGTVLSTSNLRGWQLMDLGSDAESPEHPRPCMVFVEAGVTNTECSEIALELGYRDLAWMHRMPGQLGATIRMNARCYGGEISQVVSDIFALDDQGRLQHHLGSDAFRGYKDTIFMTSHEVVVAALLTLKTKASDEEIIAEMERCESDRHRKQHFLYPSCGSAFRNNYKIGKPSGQIFDELGFKGRRCGGAEVSPYHGNFIFNRDQSTAHDILTLASEMSVAARTKGMDLMLEVQPVGRFPLSFLEPLQLQRLDPSTIIASTSVVTGLTRTGHLSPFHAEAPVGLPEASAPKTRSLDLPLLHCTLPLVGWDPRHAMDLGAVFFRVWQLESMDSCLGHQPLIRMEFVCKSEAHWSRLIEVRPTATGFQDHLWLASVFECFLLKNGQLDHYLELELQDQENWLALRFSGMRKRLDVKPEPIFGVVPFGPRPTGDGSSVALGFECSRGVLEPYLSEQRLWIKAAFAGFQDGHRSYAVAPNRSHAAQCQNCTPDFHQPEDCAVLRLLP